jgi:hypothetical protein
LGKSQYKYRLLLFLLLLICTFSLQAQSKKEQKLAEKIENKLEAYTSFFPEFETLGTFDLDSVHTFKEEGIIRIFLDNSVSHIPLREEIIATEECRIKSFLGWYYRNYSIELYAGDRALVDLVPNYYRNRIPIDSSQFSKETSGKVLFYRPEYPAFTKGLYGKHIALWPSHGRYYEQSLDRWEWQRARLHTTVEDLLPMSFVLPYLTPMLENAGAITFMSRERDLQRNEVIIDNDGSSIGSDLELNTEKFSFEVIQSKGFKWQDQYKKGDNPFKMGSYLMAKAKSYPDRQDSNWVARYIPDIPQKGRYALYISYGLNVPQINRAEYHIHSLNGVDIVRVDQSMGAGTWIFLGFYDFNKGRNQEFASIEVISRDPASLITLDAIKLGGGMGNIARSPLSKKDTTASRWKSSGLPRYMEAARYYLQYSGMPDTLVYNLNEGKNDYKDDYQCRGEWVNYLSRSGINTGKKEDEAGLGIPIDLSFAFHTDAGVKEKDTIVGTLAIYSDERDSTHFMDGVSKRVNREISDIIQTQITRDIRRTFHPDWTRRGIWNKPYSEAYRADVPTMLLELLSHQNLADINYALDPRFKFLVSRSIYKGILRFLAFQEGKGYVVQPLPVDHFNIKSLGDKRIQLSWQEVRDTLEATARPDYYQIFMRKNDMAFRLLEKQCDGISFIYELPEYGEIYSFKILAVNQGGMSFPSEILSVGLIEDQEKQVLIVNAFDRVSAPSIVEEGDFAGISFWEDEGVPYIQDISTVGMPYDYDRNSPWLDDDSPGWGASHANWEGRIIPGNSFDFSYVHGRALLANGQSFISTSDESFSKGDFSSGKILMLDLLMGEEKSIRSFRDSTTYFQVFTPDFIKQLSHLLDQDIPVFLSGAHIGTDMITEKDSAAIDFAKKRLHYTWRSNHADRMGWLSSTHEIKEFKEFTANYNSGYHPEHYCVEAPDAIEASGPEAFTFLRYKGSNASAGVAYEGKPKSIVMGLPFESILSEKKRAEFMARVILFLNR